MSYTAMRWIARILAVVLAVGLYHQANAQGGMGPGPGMVHSAGGGFTPSCSQSSTFLAAATGVTLTADKTNYDTLICGLVSDGVWNFDVLYIWAAPTQATALINLANPGTFNGTTNGTVSFAAYQGFTGDGSTFYIDSGFNPTTATSPNYVQNSATLGAYILSNRTTSQNWWAIGDGVGSVNYFRPFSGASGDAHINSATAFSLNNSNAQGSFNITRTTSSQEGSYINSGETFSGQSADTSATPANSNIIFYTDASFFGWSGDQMAAGWVAKGFAATDSCKVNNRINTYMATLASPKNVYSNSAC